MLHKAMQDAAQGYSGCCTRLLSCSASMMNPPAIVTMGGDPSADPHQSSLQALDGMHAKGVLHRDVSPGNSVWVNSEFKLDDFDISTSSSSTQQKLVARCGTSAFVSPCWTQGLPFCNAYDCHALGLTMATLLHLPGTGAAKLNMLWKFSQVPDVFKWRCISHDMRW